MVSNQELQDYEGTDRERLFQYYFGKTEQQFNTEGISFFTLDFSYLGIDLRTEEIVCDFRLAENSCNNGDGEWNRNGGRRRKLLKTIII